MLRENRKTLIVTSVVTVLPVLIGVVLWKKLPDVMATHFGFDNVANGFSSKPFAVFGIPLFCLAMLWIVAAATAADPRNKNISKKLFVFCLWLIPMISLLCGAIIYSYNLGFSLDISRIMELVMGVIFVIIGNYLPKMRHNYTMGIRVPWTLASESNWNRTHRFGGYVWVGGGLAMILLGLSGVLRPELLTGLFLVMAFVPCLYSFWLYKRGVR